MKNKNKNLPAPLKVLKDFSKKFPRAWCLCDAIIADKGTMLPSWDDDCIIPLAGTLAIAEELGGKMIDAVSMAALYAWRQYKEIYSFDEELTLLLTEQVKEDMTIPVEALKLPYPCIYIQLSSDFGFFTWYECEPHSKAKPSKELRFLLVKKDKICNDYYMLHTEQGGTILDGVNATMKEARKNAKSIETYNNLKLTDFTKKELNEALIEDTSAAQATIISRLLQIVLYICADNCDREENAEQREIRKDRDTTKPIASPKDRLAEVQQWDVGVRIGNAIRRNNSSDADTQSGSGTSGGGKKRPHSRRGHWHHYWIGSTKDDSRKLVLKWTAPMFINADDDDELPTTIHPVK